MFALKMRRSKASNLKMHFHISSLSAFYEVSQAKSECIAFNMPAIFGVSRKKLVREKINIDALLHTSLLQPRGKYTLPKLICETLP